MKEFIKNIFLISIPSLIILFILLELILSFFMPLPSRPVTIYDEQTNILKFSPESGTGTFTTGKFFQLKANWGINNHGWNYPADYQNNPEKELIAVIGDSYVEGLQVDNDKNFAWLLRNKMPGDYEVYAFGKSLYPLSQYLHVSRHVAENYNPSTLVFNVVYNDFEQSIDGRGPDGRFQGLMQLIIQPDSTISEREPYYHNYLNERLNPGFLRRIMLKSRVQRYIRYPDFLGIQPTKIFSDLTDQSKNREGGADFEDNVDTKRVSRMKNQIRLAVDYVVKNIRDENPGKRIIFMMDAPRGSIYSGEGVTNSSNYWMNELMRETTFKYGVEYINLAPLMQSDYEKNRMKFNSEVDWHWNEYGHRFVAETLYNYLMKHP